MRALVIASRSEHDDVLAIGDPEDRELRPFEQLFDHDGGAAATEPTLDEDRIHRGVRLLDAVAHDHALSKRQAVCLDRDPASPLTRPGLCGRGLREDFEVGSRDVRALHQSFSE